MEPTPQKTDKRFRLIEAAVTCFQHTGYARVSLADIAAEANVPLGNVYYYFKSKGALAQAVVEAWHMRQRLIFTEIDSQSDPRQRLLAFLQRAHQARTIYAEYGCPLANLARDLLGAGEANLAGKADAVYAPLYRWIETQFRELGYADDDVRSHSDFFVSTLQGGILMAHVHGDGRFVDQQSGHLEQWLANLERKVA